MSKQLNRVAALAAVLTISTPVIGLPQSSTPPGSSTYTWLGELVSVDTTAHKLTVKPRVAEPNAVAALKQFKAGDSVVVAWSGLDDYSDAVREVRPAASHQKVSENLAIPAEFVSAEGQNQSVTIRVKVPESGLAAVKGVNPGEWVVVTSRHRPASDADAVVSVRPYAMSTSSTNTNTSPGTTGTSPTTTSSTSTSSVTSASTNTDTSRK